MQDNNSREELDELLQGILQSRAQTDFGEENDIDNILADLGLQPHTLTAAVAKEKTESEALPNFSNKGTASAVKGGNDFFEDKSFADTFAPIGTSAKKKDGHSTENANAQREHVSLKDRLLKTVAQNSWDSDDEEDDEYPDALSAIENAAPRQDAAGAQPVSDADKDAFKNAEVFGKGEGQNAQSASFAVQEEEKADLAQDEEPTVEFAAQEEKPIRKAKQKAASFVIKPNYEEEAAFAEKRTGTMKLGEVDETFREFFGETVAIDRDELEKGLRGKKAGKLLRNFFGARMAETGELTSDIDIPLPNENGDDEEEACADDYNSPSDAPAVENTLKAMRTNCTLRVFASALTGILLLYLGLSSRTGLLPSIPVLNPANEPFLFLIINLILLIVTGLVCFPTLTGGIIGLFKEASADTMPCIALIGAILQNLVFVINPGQFNPEKTTLFAPIAAILILTNAIGKRMHCTIVCRNFDTVSVGHDHAAAYLIQDKELSARLCEGLNEPEPELLVSRPTALVRGFLRQSFSVRSSDFTARVMSYVVLASALVCGAVGYITSKNISIAISAFAAVTCFASPLASTLLSAVPSMLLQKSAARVGAVVPGWSAVAALRETNVTLVNARDLFPPSTVRLHGIKTFEKERIDLAILYAASIFIESCDTLRDIFLGVIENKTDMLYKVESVGIEPGYGFTAWIEHSRVVLGNRAMMQKHDIDIPSLDYEMKYTKGERCPIYLAVSGKLFGMFVVSYSQDDDAMEVVQGLRKSGISLLVKSDDFNINSRLVADVYDLPENSVKVLTGPERDALSAKTSYMPESEGVLTHMGTFSSFIGGLRAAAGAASGERMASMVQCAAIVLGVGLSILLSFTSGLTGISLAAVILFQCAWFALTILIPFAKRY